MSVKHLVEFPGLGIKLTVSEYAFFIGNFGIKWYAIIIVIGFILAVIYGLKNSKYMKVDEDSLLDVIMIGLIAGVIGARLYFVVFYETSYLNEPTLMENIKKLFDLRRGGLGFYGGLIGAMIAAWITAKIKKMNILSIFDLAAPCFLIGQAIGRWGNFFNQEAFGSPTNLPWGMMSDNTGNITVHPCFLYESILCIIGFVILHIFTKKYRRYEGQTIILYFMWYGFIRFFIESLRTDSLMIGPYKVSMVVAALSVVAGAVLLVVFRKKTSLIGIGNPKIMEMNGIDFEEEIETEDEEEHSTILDDMSEDEDEKEGNDVEDSENSEKETE